MTKVTVNWWDGYIEEFSCSGVKFCPHILWMKLSNGENRYIPMTMGIRWFSLYPESHGQDYKQLLRCKTCGNLLPVTCTEDLKPCPHCNAKME